MNQRRAAADLFLALLLIFASAVIAGLAAEFLFPTPVRLPATLAMQAVLVLAGLRTLLLLRSQRWADIGLVRLRFSDVSRGFVALVLSFMATALLNLCVYALSPEMLTGHFRQLRAIGEELTRAAPLVGLGLLLLLVGFYEEVLARGLLLSRCRMLLGSARGAVLASALLFGAGHFYQGWLGVFQTTIVGIVLGILTVRWATLWPAIVAHGAIDLLSIVVLSSAARP